MENTILIYMLKVSVALAVLLAFYYAFLRKDTFLRLRRFYFLFTLIFTTLYTLLKLEMASREIPTIPISYWLSQVEVTAGGAGAVATIITASGVALGICGVVTLLLIIRTLVQIFQIVRLRRNNDGFDNEQADRTVRITRLKEGEGAPFSFFSWIFVNGDDPDSEKQQEIIVHEQVHVRQLHSIDNLLFEVFCAFFWWNPLAWLLRREMRVNLEYLADEGVLKAGYNSRNYQYLLLEVSTHVNGIPIINNFNVSQLKKRITMMNKKRTSIAQSLKYLAIVPIGLALVLGNTMQASSNINLPAPDNSIETKGNESPIVVIGSEFADPIHHNATMATNDDKPFITVEHMPKYTGGEQAMVDYIRKNLKYPVAAQTAKVQGRVVVRFVVAKDGSVEDAKIMRGIHPACDAEALRIVKEMPKWVPGKHDGKNVSVYFTLPIAFQLGK